MSDAIKASLCVYDIPESARIENPSRRLRRLGIRINLSAWVIPDHLIPYSLFHELAERGAVWYHVRFDTAESEKLAKIADESLRRDVAAAVDRARKSLAAAEHAYEHPEEGKEPMSVTAFTERSEKAVKRAKELLGDLEEAARVFAIDPATLPITWAAAQTDLLRSAAHARARLYAEAGAVARARGGDGEAIGNAVAADAIPAGVVADYLMENDNPLGEQLAAVFAPDEKLDDWGDEETLSWE